MCLGFCMHEPVSVQCCQASATCLAPVFWEALPGWWPHLYHTAPLAPLSPNLIVTVAVLDIYSDPTWKAFMPSPLYRKALHACGIKPQTVFQCSPYVVFNTFCFPFTQSRATVLHVSAKSHCGDLSLSYRERLHTGIWNATCVGSNLLPHTARKLVMTAVSLECSKSHKITLKLQPWHYQVQVKFDAFEPWRWIPQKCARSIIYKLVRMLICLNNDDELYDSLPTVVWNMPSRSQCAVQGFYVFSSLFFFCLAYSKTQLAAESQVFFSTKRNKTEPH